jgi:hypothetical protein
VTPVPDEIAAPSAAPGATTIRSSRDHLPGVAPFSGGAPARASQPLDNTDPNAAGASSASTLRMSERAVPAVSPSRESGPIAMPAGDAHPNVMASTIQMSPISRGLGGGSSADPRGPADPGSAMAATARLSPTALAGAASTSDPLAAFDLSKKPGPNSTLLGVAPSSSTGGYAAVFATSNQLPVHVPPPARGQAFAAPTPPPELATSSDMVALAGYPVMSRPAVDVPAPTASGISWSFVTMIVVAIVVGVIAVWWLMRPPASAPPSTSSSAPGGATQEPSEAIKPSAPSEAIKPSAPSEAIKTIKPIDAPASPGASAAPVTARPPGAESGSGGEIEFAPEPTKQRTDPPPHADPKPAPHADPKPAPHADPKPAPHADPSHGSVPAPIRTAAVPAPSSSPPPSQAELVERYHNGAFAEVLRACSTTTVTASLAVVCVFSACDLHNVAKAKLWLADAIPSQRDNLVAYCKRVADIDLRANPP